MALLLTQKNYECRNFCLGSDSESNSSCHSEGRALFSDRRNSLDVDSAVGHSQKSSKKNILFYTRQSAWATHTLKKRRSGGEPLRYTVSDLTGSGIEP